MLNRMSERDAIYTAKEEGREEGREDVARKLCQMGLLTFEQISQVTGLTVEQINELSMNKHSKGKRL
jgi:predicted transposase YdaD